LREASGAEPAVHTTDHHRHCPPTGISLYSGLILIFACALAMGDAPDDWHEHLQQAFAAPSPEQRIPLRHLGIVPEYSNNDWYVGAVLQGYPAHGAGLRRGDRLHTINGEPFHPLRIPGPQSVTLRFERANSQQTVELLPVYENLFDSYRSATDASINRFITGNKAVTYVQLWALSRAPADLQYYRHLFNIVFRGSDALILDLRHAYGYMDWQHTDPFFASRRPFEHTGTDSTAPAETVRQFEGPVVIISNEYTRGGAETLMHHLSTSSRTMLIGINSANVPVDHQQAYPLLTAGSVDPQFEAALNILLNVL